MTTIATDGKTIAADGLSTSGDMVTDTAVQKLTRLPDGSIVGGCGELSAMLRAIDCLHAPNSHPDDLTGDFTLIRLSTGGVVTRYEGCLFGVVAAAPTAIGTGRAFAMGAMLSGKTPKEAVEIACQRDIYSGGEIVVMQPDRPAGKVVELVA